LAGTRVLFNQIHLTLDKPVPLELSTPTTIVTIDIKVVFSPTHPSTPQHFDETLAMPIASDWQDTLFQNYENDDIWHL
jgi:hypothetical protein